MSMVETTTSASMATVESLDDHGSAVRFETQCVVIPDLEHRSRLPRVVTKSYTLPLWKKRAFPSTSAPEDAPGPSEENQSHLILRLPLPTFSRKQQQTARSVDYTPLPPCLVHRAQPSTSSCAGTPAESPARYTRTPRKHSRSPSRSDIVTVPLRPCCAACQPVTEAAVVGGDAWPERFSRAASRRRSMSADGGPRTITIAGSAASASYGTLGVSISVDEIDKRRRSSDTGPSTPTRETRSDDAKLKGVCRTAASSESAADTRPPPSPSCITPAPPCIPEEEDDDENELFPLPSPRRTPTTSPAPSPAGSLSSFIATQTNQSFTCTVSPTPSSCSGDSAGPHSSKRHFLAPPPSSSSSSLSLPNHFESTTDLTLSEDLPRAPSPSLLATLPTLSGRHHNRSPSPRISLAPPTPTDMTFSATISTSTEIFEPKPVPIPTSIVTPSSSSPTQPPTSFHRSPTQPRFSWRSKRSVSADVISSKPWLVTPSRSPLVSPTLSTSLNTKKSLASPRHIIVDMLQGVGTMGSSGIGPGI